MFETLTTVDLRATRLPTLAVALALGPLLSVVAAFPQTPVSEGIDQELDGRDGRQESLGLATFLVSPDDAAIRIGSLAAFAARLPANLAGGPAPDERAKLVAAALTERTPFSSGPIGSTLAAALYPALELVDRSVPEPLVPSEYVLHAARPGYWPATVRFTVEPGKVVEATARLTRASSVLRLRVSPPDARILIDGRERVGAIARDRPVLDPPEETATDSSEVWIDGLNSGSFELEVAATGLRSYRASLQLPDLRDYELPPIALERQQAAVGFEGLPEDAVVTANGFPLDVDRQETPPEALVAPGAYDLTITHGTAGYFETSVLAEDRRRVDVEIELRPALAFLGVLGGDPAHVEGVHAALDSFREEGTYVFLDRASEASDLLRETGVGGATPSLPPDAGGNVDWAAFRERLQALAPAALYVAAVLNDEQGVAPVQLWWWSAAPGPTRPDVRPVGMQGGRLDPDALARLVQALRPERRRRAPSTGATVVESLASGGSVVSAVEPGSPAALAGLESGMEIAAARTAAGVEFETWEAAIRALGPDDVLEVSVGTESGVPALHRVEPVWGWSMLDPFHPDLLPTAAAADLAHQLKDPGDIPSWLLELELAAILLARGDIEEAVGRLRTIKAPRRGGLSQDTVRYLIALALTELAEQGRPEYAAQAVAAFRDLGYAERSRLESDSGPSVATRARLHAKTSLALVPPEGEIVVGEFRAEVLASSSDIVAVRFLVDGRLQTTQTGAGAWAMLRLARYPVQQVIRVEGLNADGQVVASDELVLNQQRGDLSVRIEEPAEGIGVAGPVQAKASLVVPKDRLVTGVEFRVGDQVQAVLQRPPWHTEIAVPATKNEFELLYLTVTATLDDGSSAEDVRILTASLLTDHVDVDLVELYTTVVDRANRPVVGLRETDFTVFEDGNRQGLAKFDLVEDLPFTVGVAVDTSGSMEDVLDEAKRAAARFLTSLMKPSDSCFAVAFDTRPHLLTGRTSDISEVVDALRGLRATGRTALHDALMTGLYYFRGVRGRRALILLSDGEDTSSAATYADVLEYAKHSEIVIYTIGLGVGRTEALLQQKLEEIAAVSGGRAFFIASAKELEPAYREIERELRSQYLLAYTSNQESLSDAFRQVEVRVAGGHRARTMSGYYP